MLVRKNSCQKSKPKSYLNAMIRSSVSTGELKYLVQNALTDDLSMESLFKRIDASYYYEGYTEFKTEDL
ncbi:cell division protein [Bacillus toyonensis]